MLRNCWLIGGAPLTGKSTLAHLMADTEDAVALSTDAIRDWMQSVCSPADHPGLFLTSDLSSAEIHERYATPADLLEVQLQEGREVELGITGLLKTRYLTWDRLVLEGVALSPGYMAGLSQLFPTVRFHPVVLHHSDNTLPERLRQRGLRTNRQGSSDPETDREREWIELCDEFFRSDAARHRIPTRRASAK